MAELHTILCDGFDRQVFGERLRADPALARTVERARRVLPHAEELLCDLFSALFKLNVVLRQPHEISAAVQINRRLVEGVLKSGALDDLRARTQLQRVDAAASAAVLADRALAALMREYRVDPAALAETATAADDEADLAARESELSHLDQLPDGAFDEETRERLKSDLKRDVDRLKGRIERARKKQSELASNLTTEVDDAIAVRASALPEHLDDVESHLRGLGLGGRGRMSAERSLQLGERLLSSKKLRLLARLAGAFREVAFEARRKRVVRVPQEVHAVTAGRHLDRLLPSELLGLSRRRKALHREFCRRLAEGQLLEYELHGASSRGPMVVCVDGSGSMSGSKELWAKAVALTLMEIARREKRRCLAIIFSSGHELFEVELIGNRTGSGGRAVVRDEQVMQFAEHFPGGGTSFEEPLEKATAAVSAGNYRNGDIVFITDGEATVSETLLEDLTRKRKKHRFKIRGILVDVSHASGETLERFCDDVRKVTDLTSESLSDLFSAV